MESVGSNEEEVKLNIPVPAPHMNICKGPLSYPPSFHRYQISLPSRPMKMCQEKGRERKREENLLCWKRSETPHLYLER